MWTNSECVLFVDRTVLDVFVIQEGLGSSGGGASYRGDIVDNKPAYFLLFVHAKKYSSVHAMVVVTRRYPKLEPPPLTIIPFQ